MHLTAKLVGTSVVARLFALTQPALMTLPWFARLYARWSAWKTSLLEHTRVLALAAGATDAPAVAQPLAGLERKMEMLIADPIWLFI